MPCGSKRCLGQLKFAQCDRGAGRVGGTTLRSMRWARMSKESLRKQADRAENIADQTVDDQLKETLRDAAKEYREKAKHETESPA